MISIRVFNHAEIVKNKKGWFAQKAYEYFGNPGQVENVIAEEIKKTLLEKGIDTEVTVFL